MKTDKIERSVSANHIEAISCEDLTLNTSLQKQTEAKARLSPHFNRVKLLQFSK